MKVETLELWPKRNLQNQYFEKILRKSRQNVKKKFEECSQKFIKNFHMIRNELRIWINMFSSIKKINCPKKHNFKKINPTLI